MEKRIRLLIIVLLVAVSRAALSQGCSDAGFCTMGAMKPDQPYNKRIDLRLRSMELSFYRGTTALTPRIFVVTADMNFSISSKTSFQLKVPYQWVNGKLANTAGMGDLSLCVTRTVRSSDKYDINFSLGGKIPTNQSDKRQNGRPLPMYYQTSLGTWDIITGVSLISRKWLFATGVQHALNSNENNFLWSEWAGSDEDPDYIRRYHPARTLRRGTDVMLRVERNFRFSRFNFSAGLLPILRIRNDRTVNGLGNLIEPEGAKGLALSAIVTAGYQFNVKSGVKILAGHKIVQRDFNPDGLTREMVTSVSYFYRF